MSKTKKGERQSLYTLNEELNKINLSVQTQLNVILE
jgi:hypothetical protein